MQHREGGLNDNVEEGPILLGYRGNKKGIDQISRRPAFESVPAFIENCARIKEEDKPAIYAVKKSQEFFEKLVVRRQVLATLELGEVTAHVTRSPGVIAGKLRDVIPFLVVRRDCDHRVMPGASADTGATRI